MNIKKFFILIIITLIVDACANISPPAGGPKDETPPKLINLYPKENSTLVNGKIIQLTFNERVVLEKVKEQLLINPVPKGEYKSLVKKNTVIIEFEENLDKSTTYNLNFREAIKDATEKNPAQNLEFAFSTGAHIDSLNIAGYVFDYENNLPLKKAIVSVYNTNDTTNIRNGKPIYLTLTNEEGIFLLKNLAVGTYDIYALADKNNNSLLDQNNEKAALLDTFMLSKDTNIVLNAITVDFIKLKLLTSKAASTKEYILTYNKGILKYKLNTIDKDSIISSVTQDGKNIRIYKYNLPKKNADTTFAICAVTDTIGNTITDTIAIKFLDKPQKDDEEKKTAISSISPQNKLLEPQSNEIELIFSDPVRTYKLDNIEYKKDSIPFKIKKEQYTWNANKTKLNFNLQGNFKDSLIMYIPYATFITINGDSNIVRKEKFNLKKEEQYSIIEGEVITDKKNYIIELVNSKYQPIRKVIKGNIFKFNYIEPGVYFLRAYIDKNKNGKWDRGDFLKKMNAEPLYYYPDPIELRANWEIMDTQFEF